MKRALLLGGGEPAKWIFEAITDRQPDLTLFSMGVSEEHQGQSWNIAGSINPADMREVFRTLSRHEIDSIAVFGNPFSNLTPMDLTKSTFTILRALASAASTGRPDLAFPNTLFEALLRFLKQREISVFSLQEILPRLRFNAGEKIGNVQLTDWQNIHDDACNLWRGRRRTWRKHGILTLAGGERVWQTSGTKSLLKKCVERGMDLRSATLAITEVAEYAHLDTPVIDEALIRLSAEFGLSGIVADTSSLVIDREKLGQIADQAKLAVHFV